MDAGSMVEFDHPHKLLQHIGGVLRGMAEQTGKATYDALARQAKTVRIYCYVIGWLVILTTW